jgi:hypothetical protein
MPAIRTILARGCGERYEAQAAAGTIKPGHLLQLNSTGKVAIHAGAALNAPQYFAVENDLIGKTIDDLYATDDVVQYVHAARGAEIYALVAAAAAAIVIGDYVESAGDGTVRKAATDTATDNTQRLAMVGQAVEAVDNSGGGSAVRLRIRIT